jgi:hypothetical protein
MTMLKTAALVSLALAAVGCIGPDYSIGTKPIGSGPADQPVTAAPVTTASASMPMNVTAVEVETFTLVNAPITNVTDASGGKAVQLAGADSSAKSTVTLKQGTYEVTLYIKATDPDHDALLLTLNGEQHRLFTNDYDHVVPCDETVPLEMKADGPCDIAITPAETGMEVDKVDFKKTK